MDLNLVVALQQCKFAYTARRSTSSLVRRRARVSRSKAELPCHLDQSAVPTANVAVCTAEFLCTAPDGEVCYEHSYQRQVAAPKNRVATAKIRTLSHDGGVQIYLYMLHQTVKSAPYQTIGGGFSLFARHHFRQQCGCNRRNVDHGSREEQAPPLPVCG